MNKRTKLVKVGDSFVTVTAFAGQLALYFELSRAQLPDSIGYDLFQRYMLCFSNHG